MVSLSDNRDEQTHNIRLGKMRADEQRHSTFGSLLHQRFRRTKSY